MLTRDFLLCPTRRTSSNTNTCRDIVYIYTICIGLSIVAGYNRMHLLYPHFVYLPRVLMVSPPFPVPLPIPLPFPIPLLLLLLCCYVDNSVLPRRTMLRSLKSISCDSIDWIDALRSFVAGNLPRLFRAVNCSRRIYCKKLMTSFQLCSVYISSFIIIWMHDRYFIWIVCMLCFVYVIVSVRACICISVEHAKLCLIYMI